MTGLLRRKLQGRKFLTAALISIAAGLPANAALAQQNPNTAIREYPVQDHVPFEWGTEELRKTLKKNFEEGVEALKIQDYETAEERFDEVLSIAERHPEANFFMALAKIGLDKKKAAKNYLLTAIRAKSDYVEARETLAMLLVEMEQAPKAQKQLDELAKLKAKCEKKGCEEAYVARLDQALAKIQAAIANA